MSQAPVMIVTK